MMDVDETQTYEEVVYILREDGTIEEKITLPDRVVEQVLEEGYGQPDNAYGGHKANEHLISVTELVGSHHQSTPTMVSTNVNKTILATSSKNDFSNVTLVNAGEEFGSSGSVIEGIGLDDSMETQLFHLNGLEQYGSCIAASLSGSLNGSNQIPQQLMELDDTTIDSNNINIIELDERDQNIQLITSPESPNKFIIATSNSSFGTSSGVTRMPDPPALVSTPTTYSFILPRTYQKSINTTGLKKGRGVSPKFLPGQGVTQLLLAHEVSSLSRSMPCIITGARSVTEEELEMIRNTGDADEFVAEANPEVVTYGTVEIKTKTLEEKEKHEWNGIPLLDIKKEKIKDDKASSDQAVDQEPAISKEISDFTRKVKSHLRRRTVRKNWLWSSLDNDDELLRNVNRKRNMQKQWMCTLCYFFCKDKADLDSHFREKHFGTAKFHKCRFCSKAFIARFLCLRHEKTHKHELRGPLKLYCKPSGEPLPTFVKQVTKPAPLSEAYTGHLLQLLKKMELSFYQCVDCDKKFSAEEYVREHYELRHAAQECVFCNMMFDNLACLEDHMNEVHDFYFLKSFPTDYWSLQEVMTLQEEGKRNDGLAALVQFMHNYSKRPDQEPVEERNYCNTLLRTVKEDDIIEKKPRTFSKFKFLRKKAEMPKLKLQTSKKSEDSLENGKPEDDETNPPTLNPESPFECQLCFETLADDNEFSQHMKLKHTYEVKPKPFACNFCEKKFATHSNRKEHERIHTNEKNYVCPFCNKAFIQISNLKKHISTHKDQNLRCDTCDKQFVTKNSLVLHQRAHAADRKFKCNVCDRAYNYASLLKRHMRIHTGECPYECDICFQPFHELVSLHYHRKKVHTGERPHKCTTCGKAFILSSDLKKHLLVHNKTESNVNAGPKAGRLQRTKKSTHVQRIRGNTTTIKTEQPAGTVIKQEKIDTEDADREKPDSGEKQ